MLNTLKKGIALLSVLLMLGMAQTEAQNNISSPYSGYGIGLLDNVTSSPLAVEDYMDAICAELTEEWDDSPLREDAVGVWTGEGYLRRVHRAAQVLTRFAINSEFRTIATEQDFADHIFRVG